MTATVARMESREAPGVDPGGAPLVLVREGRAATAWGIPALMLLVAGTWLLLDARGGLLGVLSFVVFALVAGVFLVPWLAPDRHLVRFDDEGVTFVVPWRTRLVPWSRVQTVRLSRLAGDPFLEVEALDDRGRVESIGMLLPVGADVAAAHEWLRARQSSAPFPDPATAPPGVARGGRPR